MSEHDPGDLYEPPPRRRDYAQEDEYDEAWGAGDQGNIGHPGIDSEDQSAGHPKTDRERYGVGSRAPGPDDASDPGPLPPPPPRHRRPNSLPADPRTNPYYDPDQLYADSPSYRRKRGIDSPDSVLPPVKKKGIPKRKNSPYGSFHMPYWQILILVILGVMALFAVTLAIVSVLVL